MSGFKNVTNPYEGTRNEGVQLTQIVTNYNDPAILSRDKRPPLFTVEKQYSASILVDSKDRIYSTDTDFDITVDLSSNIFRGRRAKVEKVCIPTVNNINPLNNTIAFSIYEAGVPGTPHSFTAVLLQPAVYDPVSLSNEIVYRLNNAIAGLGYTGVFACSFDAVLQTFSLETTSPALTFFILHDGCSFITRGRFVHGFSGDPSTTAVGSYHGKIRSARAAMLYTRFLTIHSERLTELQFTLSRTSDPLQGRDIIAIIDLSSAYRDGEWSSSVLFAGAYKTLSTPDSPNIEIVNSERNITRYIDFSVKDEYGFNLNQAMENTIVSPLPVPDPAATVVNPNKLGFSLWLSFFS